MARQTKRSKTELEKLIMTVWYETKKGKLVETDEQATVVKAIGKTVSYLKMADYLDGTNHTDIFKKIYLNVLTERSNTNKVKISKQKTMAGFADGMYLSAPTLTVYTNKYIKCFGKYLSEPAFDTILID